MVKCIENAHTLIKFDARYVLLCSAYTHTHILVWSIGISASV